MALHLMPSLGSRRVISLICSRIKIGGLWGQLSQIPWHPSSSSSSSSNVLHRCGSSIPALAATESAKKNLDHDKALCGGTSIYRDARKDEWIITLAKFAVDNHNENQVITFFTLPSFSFVATYWCMYYRNTYGLVFFFSFFFPIWSIQVIWPRFANFDQLGLERVMYV